jgi:hypothetical protein
MSFRPFDPFRMAEVQVSGTKAAVDFQKGNELGQMT